MQGPDVVVLPRLCRPQVRRAFCISLLSPVCTAARLRNAVEYLVRHVLFELVYAELILLPKYAVVSPVFDELIMIPTRSHVPD